MWEKIFKYIFIQFKILFLSKDKNRNEVKISLLKGNSGRMLLNSNGNLAINCKL